jgi:hypothetical protein
MKLTQIALATWAAAHNPMQLPKPKPTFLAKWQDHVAPNPPQKLTLRLPRLVMRAGKLLSHRPRPKTLATQPTPRLLEMSAG